MRKRNILIAVLCCVLVFSAFPGKGEAAPQRECVQQYQSARMGFATGNGEEGCNAYDMVFDAVAKFCAYYNSHSGGSFGEVMSCGIDSGTELRINLSTDRLLTAKAAAQFEKHGVQVLHDMIAAIEKNVPLAENVTICVKTYYPAA